jgi:intracellular multiplication protein IcmP
MRPQPNPRATWASSDDNGGFFMLVIVIGLGVLSYVAWLNYHATISTAVMAFFHQEIGLLRQFTDRFDVADKQMMASDPEGVTLHDLYGISHAIGMFLRLPATAFMVLLAMICAIRATPSRYRRGFDLDGLARELAVSFPVTAGFAKRHLRLVKPSPEPRPSDYAMTPEEWAATWASQKDGTYDEVAAHRALVLQLGPVWRGVEQAAPHVRCLFVVFALHRSERRAEALRLLGLLSGSLDGQGQDRPEGPDKPLMLAAAAISAADAELPDYAVMTPARRIAARYAYTNTALMGLLTEARRQAGVLAPAQFAWLKLVDRPLWYALHALGFETDGYDRYLHPNPRAEAIGARDHWAVELAAGEPVIEPAIDRALDAVRAVAARARLPAATA